MSCWIRESKDFRTSRWELTAVIIVRFPLYRKIIDFGMLDRNSASCWTASRRYNITPWKCFIPDIHKDIHMLEGSRAFEFCMDWEDFIFSPHIHLLSLKIFTSQQSLLFIQAETVPLKTIICIASQEHAYFIVRIVLMESRRMITQLLCILFARRWSASILCIV